MAIDTSNMMSENVILIDAAYADKVASILSTHFENELGRKLPKADLAEWLVCLAKESGVTASDNTVQVVFLHGNGTRLCHFMPSDFENEINGKAFGDSLGEFTLEAYPVANDVTTTEEQYVETLRILLDSEKVKRITLVANTEEYADAVTKLLRKENKGKNVTLMTMVPLTGEGFTQQVLGFSIMAAMGIGGNEV